MLHHLEIPDPPLTKLGILQSRDIETRLPDNISIVVCSSLKRSLQTVTWLSNTISDGAQIIVWPDLIEDGDFPSSSESSLAVMQATVEQAWGRNRFDFSLVQNGFEAPSSIEARVKRTRHDLIRLIHEVEKPGGGQWKGIEVGTDPRSNQKAGIVVVSHAGFLHELTNMDKKDFYRNGEVRTLHISGGLSTRPEDGALRGKLGFVEMTEEEFEWEFKEWKARRTPFTRPPIEL